MNCQDNISKFMPKSKSVVKESIYENSRKNMEQRMFLQRNASQVLQAELDRYNENTHCCDSYQYPSNIVKFNNGYATLKNFRR